MGDAGRTILCGQCKTAVPVLATLCPLCRTPNPHYEPPPPDAKPPPAKRPGGTCAFTFDDMQCPLVAVWWPHAYSKGSPGFCRVHADELARARDAGAARELREIVDHPERFARRSPEWRDAAVSQVLAEHPEWTRRSDETRDQYRERMQELRERLAPRGLLPPRAPTAARGDGAVSQVPPAVQDREPGARLSEEALGDALEQLEERAGKYEAEGTPHELATRLALEDVLRERLAGASA